jgi:hypothetical protein
MILAPLIRVVGSLTPSMSRAADELDFFCVRMPSAFKRLFVAYAPLPSTTGLKELSLWMTVEDVEP